MGLIIPGFIPDTLGEIYEYMPSMKEVLISVGIWAFGAMIYTMFVRVVIALDTGRLRHPGAPAISLDDDKGTVAGDIMTRDVVTVGPDATVEEISRILSTNRISGVPVVNDENRVVGVVSESDIIFSEIHKEPWLVKRLKNVLTLETQSKIEEGGETAEELMTSPPVTAGEDTPVRDIIDTITERNIKRLIIVDEEDHPIGIVTKMDIVKALERI
jgi:CBS domain-containing protein